MQDGYNRKIDYLRISLTDKCNLRCKYCMPEEGIQRLEHDSILTLEEIERIVAIMAQEGISKVRLTGGEPLVRKNLVTLIANINAIPTIKDIAITTNGILFPTLGKELYEAGCRKVNFSLDTLNQETFKRITGYDGLEKVLEAINLALELGMQVKINCVACKELNDADIEKLALLAKDQDIDVRYIELMPVGCGKNYTGISSETIKERLELAYGKATPYEGKRGNGPAHYVSFEGFQGKIGFISPISHQFCEDCNRIRLTAEGSLKLCLHYNRGIDLKQLLRSGASDSQIREAIMGAVNRKPKAHDFIAQKIDEADDRKMVQIGG